VANKIRRQPKKTKPLAYASSDANSRANPNGQAGYGRGKPGPGKYKPPRKWVKRPKYFEYGRVTKRTRIT
jgi:hypothetical protein